MKRNMILIVLSMLLIFSALTTATTILKVPEEDGPMVFGEQRSPCYEYVLGDVNHDGETNGLDVIYLVNYLKGGPAPPFEFDDYFPGADANGDCTVNGLDVIYLVNFFKGGSAPQCCPDYPPCE